MNRLVALLAVAALFYPSPHVGAEATVVEPIPAQGGVEERKNAFDIYVPTLGPGVVAHLQSIAARNLELRESVFAKMGGSIVVSRAFLHCFDTDYVVLDEFESLSETVSFFRSERVRGKSSFSRESLAAGVGWSLYYPLAGRPPRFQREVNAIRPRFALVLFGGNDANAKTERVYARRLVRLVERLAKQGVIPILGSSTPRRSKARDVWTQRYNQITEAIASQWKLPFVDYYAALRSLPRLGLARDGVHPNVLGRGGLRNACRFDEAGLQHGQNVRNLLTIKALDDVRWALVEQVEPRSEDVPASTEVVVEDLPFSAAFGEDAELAFRISLKERTRVRASAFAIRGARPRLTWEREDGTPIKARNQTLVKTLDEGAWTLRIARPQNARPGGRLLVLLTDGP